MITEGCAGANENASPPGRHQEQASKQRCTFSHTTFSSVQFSSVLSRGFLCPQAAAERGSSVGGTVNPLGDRGRALRALSQFTFIF